MRQVRILETPGLGVRRMTAESVTAKAARYLTAGRVLVIRVDGDLVDARVRGDSGTYIVRRDPGGWWCSCPVRRPECSHITAVRLVTVATVATTGRTATE